MPRLVKNIAAGILGGLVAATVYYAAFELAVDDGTAINRQRLFAATSFCGIVGFVVAMMPSWTGGFCKPKYLLLLMLAPLTFLFFDAGNWDNQLTKALLAPAMVAAVSVGLLLCRPPSGRNVAQEHVVSS